jgi:hypothetical protein
MGSRSALLEDALPAVEIESFAVERVSRPRTARVVDVRPPRSTSFERLRRRYDLTIGAYRDFEPRLHPTVERRVDLRADDVIEQLCPRGAIYDALEHEYRVRFELHIPWSWPALPMWLTVSEASSTKCALRLSLRSRRRMRYPRRYFHAAHAALRDVESRISDVTRRSGATSSG